MLQPKQKLALLLGALLILAIGFITTDQPDKTAEQPLATALMQMEGVGRVELYIHYPEKSASFFDVADNSSAPVGVLVIAEGANQPSTRHKLRQTVASVLQISQHRIQVEPMEGDFIDP